MPVQPLRAGVTSIVEVTGVFPVLIAIKEAIFPVPDAGMPIVEFELVQAIDAPGLDTKFIPGTIAPSYTVVSVLTVTVGTGFTSYSKLVPTAH